MKNLKKMKGTGLWALAIVSVNLLMIVGALARPASVSAKVGATQQEAPSSVQSSERYTIAGNEVTKVPTTDVFGRGTMTVRNEDATYSVWVKVVQSGATAPTTTTVLDTPYKLAPSEARTYAFTAGLDVYVMNSSGGATTSAVYVECYQRGGVMVGAQSGAATTVTGSFTGDTELPAVETPADNLTNATQAPRVNGLGYLFDGTNWDRARGDSTDGALVNLGANNDVTASQTGTWTVQPGNTANTTAWLVSPTSATTGGCSLYSLICTGTSGDATNIKASAGQVYAVTLTNINASPVYFKMYNSASAPTAGSGTPVLRIMVPGSTTGAGTNITIPVGAAFTTGIGFTVVTGIADNSSTGVTASQVLVNVYYK